jgi:SNF2 family DNA or RNA helicase
LKLNELEAIVFKSASRIMKKEGEEAFIKGLVTYLKGKKIDSIYHVYGRVRDESKLKELNTHIRINLEKKKLQGIECTCEEFKEFASSGYFFMCSHLTATAYRFFSKITKDAPEAGETAKGKSSEAAKIVEISGIPRLIRKAERDMVHYEVQASSGGEKLILEPDELRSYLENIRHGKIKFKYDYIEFTMRILHKDLPVTFNLKECDGHLVVTTHKQMTVPLNSKNDVYLFKNELYLPSENQVKKYIPIYEKLKAQGEILFRRDINQYLKVITLLSSITQNINISEEVKSFISNTIKPEFFIFREQNRIYCDVTVSYGSKRVNILQESKGSEVFIRSCKKEEKLLMNLEKHSFIKIKNRFMFTGGDEELYDILTKHENSITCLGTVILGKGLKDLVVYTSSSLKAALNEIDGFFSYSYKLGDIEGKELKSAFEAYKSKKRFYKTRKNGFIDLEDEGVQGFFNIFEVLNIDENIEGGSVKIEKSKALFLYENIRNKELGFIKGVEAIKVIEDKLTNLNDNHIALPDSLRGTLRTYQISGFRWLKTLSELGLGGILADEMGLGKTIQTIAFILSEENKKTLIVCPTSLIYNWKAEIEKFAPSLKVGIVHGTERIRVIESLNEYDVILTTYGTLRLDIELYKDIIFNFCIIDEGQNIKNFLAQNTKIIKEIKASVRFALTGTPIENNLTELWSIFDFIMPGYLYTKESFEEKFIIRAEDNLEALKLLIKPFILRRTKKEVMKELPDKIEKKFLVEMTKAQKVLYTSCIKSLRDIMKNNTDGKIEVFSYLTRLRQICLDPSLIVPEYAGGSGKLKVAMEIINDHTSSKGKVLLFSQFTSVLNKIGDSLSEEGINFFYLDGNTKPKERIRRVNDFNTNEDIKVFLISLKAGGTGLNLTSANLIIHFDPWWNPAVEDQATDRAHRFGQREAVEVIKLIAKGTIEEKIVSLQEDKKELIDSIITGELQKSDLISRLSREEILQLFTRE